MKNKKVPQTEQKMLLLLEQVFGQCKQDMPKETVMNPFFYLESIFNKEEQTEITSLIDIFSIQSPTMDLTNEKSFDL